MTHPGAIAWFTDKPVRKAARRKIEEFREGQPARRKAAHLERKRLKGKK